MTYIKALKHPVVARLTLIQFISYFGTWFSQVAIASMLVSYGASEMQIASIFIMLMLPAILLAPISGWIIDHIEFKKLMRVLLIVEIIMTLLFMTVNSLDDIGWLMFFVFVRSLASSTLFSAEMALFPKILEGDMLRKTNEIHSIVWAVCFALGMAVGGIVTHYFGYDITFLIDMVLYIFASFLLIGLHIKLKPKEHLESAKEMIVGGFIYLKNHKKLLHLIFLHATVGLTSFDTLVTLLADYHYKYILAIPLAIGWINASRALGLFLGTMLFSSYIHDKTLHYILAIQGVLIIFWALVQTNFTYSLIGIFVVGLLSTSLWSYTYYMIQREIEQRFLGRVIAYNDMIFMLTNVFVTLFIGYLAQKDIDLKYITMSLGVGFIFASFYYIWFRKRFLV
jgi:MFS family permease